jgi:serine protease Do
MANSKLSTHLLLGLVLGISTGFRCSTPVADPEPALAPATNAAWQDPPARRLGSGAIDPAHLEPILQQLPTADERAARVTPVVLAVGRAAPAVVSIKTGRKAVGDWYFQTQRDVTDGQGSGVIVDPDGLVITNWHVIWNARNEPNFFVKVALNDGSELDAEVLHESPEDDLALLRIRNAGSRTFTPVVMGSSKDLMIGETVIAIGNPRGQANSVTVGVLSATGRDIAVPWPNSREVHRFTNLLQTDAAINPGNSGGALLDITGKLIGINNALRSDSIGINFAIPVDRVHEVFHGQLLAIDGSSKLWLGMGVEPASDDNGIRVQSIEDHGPAREAGLREGDRIVSVAGTPVRSLLR